MIIPQHKLNMEKNMMVDVIVKSKKHTPRKLLCLKMLLQCSFFILREIVKVKKGLTRSYLFFENAKNLGRSDEAKLREKEDGLKARRRRLAENVT